MLPKKKRIPRILFKKIISSKLGGYSKYFSIRYSEPDNTEVRFAVSVSKKVSKSAVIRNKTRRRVYSAAASLLPSLKNGLYFISVKAGAESLKLEDIKAELQKMLLKNGFVSSDKKG